MDLIGQVALVAHLESFFERELAVAEQFEPNLYRAAIHVFGKSYEYTRQYREFQKKMEGGAE